MTATLTVTPNPAPPSSAVAVAGSGFPYARTRLLLDGAGATTNTFRPRKDGTFNVGVTVGSVVKTQTLVAQQLANSVWTTKAQVSIVVQAAAPPPPPPTSTVTVTSLAALAAALADDTNTDITLAPATYSGNFWVDGRFAARTNPVIVRCAGATLQGYLTFRNGSHDQDWRDLTFANINVNQAGCIGFGGYAGEPGPHHISIRNFTVASSVHRVSPDHTTDHSVYFSYAVGGAHDILIENLHVTATDQMAIASGIHMDHGTAADAPNVNAWNVTIRGMRFTGNNGTGSPTVQYPVILWVPPIHDWTFDDIQATDAGAYAFQFESIGAARINISNFVSTGSRFTGGSRGSFNSSMGANPPGVVFGAGNSFK